MLFVWLFLYGAVMLLCPKAVPYGEMIGLTLYTLALVVWILATGKGASLGFRKVSGWKKHLFFIPWLLPAGYHLFRFGICIPPWAEILSILCPVVLEEILFRGYLMKILPRGIWGLVASSIAFAATHLLNLENGVQPMFVICQVVFALCVGFSLAGLRLSCGSIFPCVGIHFLINVTAGAGVHPEKDLLFWLCTVLYVGCGIYSIFMLKKGERENVTG